MIEFLQNLNLKTKRFIAVSFDLSVALISFPLALLIRLGDLSFLTTPDIFAVLAIFFIAKALAIFAFRPSRAMWMYASVKDLMMITKFVIISSLIAIAATVIFNRADGLPRTAFAIDAVLMLIMMGGARLAFRLLKERRPNGNGEPTLVIGAGNAGEQIIRDIMRSNQTDIRIVGIIDDDQNKVGRTIHGYNVIGTSNDLEDTVKRLGITELILAIPSASTEAIKKLHLKANELNVKLLVLPGVNDIVGGKVKINQLRPIKIEDLLGRDPIKLDSSNIAKMLNNRVVMVTGAGGSIGSELCNQILKFGPEKLILFEQCEYFIYKTHMELSKKFPGVKIIPVVGDVRDNARLEEVFTKYSPFIIFHAAAYKHVPMMERNPIEAIKTNVIGTHNLCTMASKYGVEKFVMISTDKAVNPTNIMGATKRCAEQICAEVAKTSKTKFAVTRFGNVLGSSGSVIPLFMKQIEQGGPITVTHPEINRFFMSIPEACQLVLQAGTLSNGGEIFVFDMGDPVKIVDLARDMIKFSGVKGIDIVFTGLRPGEKLYEEVLADKEETLETPHPKIRIAKARNPEDNFFEHAKELLTCDDIKAKMKELIPEYNSPNN